MASSALDQKPLEISREGFNEDVLEQLVTHIPDIVVQRPVNSPNPQTVRSYGVLMFADISGFTALCEKYCSTSESKKRGTDQLTSTLNTYLSQIVEAILKDGGDVLKFAGDALLAYWDCSRFEASGTLQFVLQGGLNMQTDYDNYQTPDGVTLRMKLSLSVGSVDIHYIGNETYKTFDVTGAAVDDVNTAQSFTKPGTVVISKNAWEMCNQDKCFARLVGKDCAQIFKISVDANEPTPTLTDLISTGYRRPTLSAISKNAVALRQSSASSTKTEIGSIGWKTRVNTRRGSVLSKSHELSLRVRTKKELQKFDEIRLSFIKSFILHPVVHKIDHGYDVNWLSELRQVSVLFINLDPVQSSDSGGTIGDIEQQLLQTAFEAVYPSLAKFDGILNKVFMFDKGCTFLCIFGLPHSSHEDDPTRALRASRSIFNKLSSMNLNHYSIGVTTGVAFCGVVGHSQRHEYTVIGQKVNMAARLMMKFPDALTCDESTFAKSGISPGDFTLAPPVKLKGISKPEDIYFVTTENTDEIPVSNSDIHEATDADTLIGRKKEMDILMAELEHLMEQSHKGPGIIVLTGPGGIGKTKLLRAMKAKAAEMNFRVVSGTGGLIEQNTPFFTVKTLLTRLLELDTCSNIHDKEQLILQHIVDDDLRKLLPILNDLLVLKFPHTEETLHMCHKERTRLLHKMLFRIVHEEALTHPCLFGVDDAQWIDADSWNFLLDLALDPHAILLLATRPLKDIHNSELVKELWNHPNTIVLELEGLSCEEMIELACQLLNVEEVPDQIVDIIRTKSHGVPLWCEELIETMIEMKVLTVIEQDEVIYEEDEDEESDAARERLSDRNISSSLSTRSHGRRKAVLKTVKRRKSCVGQEIGIGDIPIPDSVAGMVLTRIDNMNPSEQMSLKCAAVLGTSFHREMLQSIIPNCNPITFRQTLNVMAEHGIIECAIASEVKTRLPDMHTRSAHRSLTHLPEDPHLQCPCLKSLHHYHHDNSHLGNLHPPIEKCDRLQFVHTYVQETAYDLWTETQCQALHESAAVFLETQAHKCVNCGGGGFFMGLQQTKGGKRKSSIQKGRAFMGTSAIRHKVRRSSTATENRRSRRISSTSSDGPATSLSELQQAWNEEREMGSTQRPITARGQIRFESICPADLSIDMQDCHCDEVLSHVYPQLVQHWKAAGDVEKTLKYLLESASAALATFNNMEAISLLQEAREIIRENGENMLQKLELAKLESLFGQAYFQCGEVDECMPYFCNALRMLDTHLPTSNIGATYNLIFQTAKQVLHVKFPRRFIGRKRGQDSEKFLDQSRCMAHVTHAYHLQHENMKTLMSALQQLNSAEEAQEDIHELVESYSTMIECCQLFNFTAYGEMYLEKALILCSSVQFGAEDISTYAHLLNVALNFKLCHGMIKYALEIGSAVTRITSRVHDVPMKLAALPLLFEANLQALRVEQCKENLKQLSEVSDESDDLRAQALMDCCRFDALLEIGLNNDNGHELARSAELCCEEDVYHFDDIERCFLISSLALWHCRKDNTTTGTKFITLAETLLPKRYETFFSVKALAKYLECKIMLYKADNSNAASKKGIKKELKVLKTLVKKFKFFTPRYLHLKAYFKHLQHMEKNAKFFLQMAATEADRVSSELEAAWVARSYSLWFENKLNTDPRAKMFSLQ